MVSGRKTAQESAGVAGDCSRLRQLQLRRKQNQNELFANFQWSRAHETEHAEAIFRWWWASAKYALTGSARDMLWSRQINLTTPRV